MKNRTNIAESMQVPERIEADFLQIMKINTSRAKCGPLESVRAISFH
jgi:hypothetical protein